jgi:hypothetical protein
MRKVLLVLGIAILCLPMLFVTWLLLASRWQKMDPTTAHAPLALRQAVASIILQKAGYGKKSLPALNRILRLDPKNAGAWQRRCSIFVWDKSSPNLKDCEAAVQFAEAPGDYYNLGRAQETIGDPCTAEDSYTHAVSATSSNPDTDYLEAMGRAALRCNHLPGSRAGFELAIETQQKWLNQPDQDQDEIDDAKKDILADQESLIVIYHRQHDDTLAGQTCTAAHPGWKSCSCDIDAKGIASCTEAKPPTPPASTHPHSARP